VLKGNDMIGMPIVAYDTGEEIKKVKDLIFDSNSKLIGFLVEEKFWWNTQVLPVHSIKVMGPDAIVASSATAIVSARRLPEIKQALKGNIVFTGTKIVTEEGYDLGTIADLYFDKYTGAIEGYEVWGGLFADANCPVSFVPAPPNFKIGQDVAFVPSEIAAMMEEQVSEWNEMLPAEIEQFSSVPSSSANLSANGPQPTEAQAYGMNAANGQEKTPKRTSTVTRSQSVISQNFSGLYPHPDPEAPAAYVGEWQPESFSAVAQLPNEPVETVEQTLGRRVRSAVKTQEGIYVAAIGQIVTEKVIARSKIYGQEEQLMAAVSQAALMPGTNHQWEQNLLPRRKRAGNLGTKFGNAVNDWQQGFNRAIEKWRVQRIIGRAVDRVILDRQDNIILEAGELITYKAIEQARQANVIGILLNSAQKQGSK
jgi:uncharacterized protein YrrD